MRGNFSQRLLQNHPLFVVAAYFRYGTPPAAEDKTCVISFYEALGSADKTPRHIQRPQSSLYSRKHGLPAVENQEEKEK
jgi:hypothetical protein